MSKLSDAILALTGPTLLWSFSLSEDPNLDPPDGVYYDLVNGNPGFLADDALPAGGTSADGGMFAEIHGGYALSMAATQYFKLYNYTTDLSWISGGGLTIMMLARIAGATITDTMVLWGTSISSGGGIKFEISAAHVLKLSVWEGDGTLRTWSWDLDGAWHLLDSWYHLITVEVALTSGAPSTISMAKLYLKGRPYKPTAHNNAAGANVGTISDIGTSYPLIFWGFNADGTPTANDGTTAGVMTLQQITAFAGVMTEVQHYTLAKAAFFTFNGIVDPLVACYFDSASTMYANDDLTGTLAFNGSVGSVQNQALHGGNSAGIPSRYNVSINQTTSTHRPRFTGRSVDFMGKWAGQMESPAGSTFIKFLNLIRNTSAQTKQLYRTDCSVAAAVGPTATSVFGVTNQIVLAWNKSGAATVAGMAISGGTDRGVFIKEGSTSGNEATHPIPSCLPSICSLVTQAGWRKATGLFDLGYATMCTDGSTNLISAEGANVNGYSLGFGTYGTPLTADGGIDGSIGGVDPAIAGSGAYGGSFSGEMFCLCAVDQTVSTLEQLAWDAAMHARYPNQNPATWSDVLFASGDSITACIQGDSTNGRLSTSRGWFGNYLPDEWPKTMRCYNISRHSEKITDYTGAGLQLIAATPNPSTDRISTPYFWVVAAGKRLTVIHYIGTNDTLATQSNGKTEADTKADYDQLLTAVINATGAATSLRQVTCTIRPGTQATGDALNTLIHADDTDYPYVVTIPAFYASPAHTNPAEALNNNIHPVNDGFGDGMQEIADAVSEFLIENLPEIFAPDGAGSLLLLLD